MPNFIAKHFLSEQFKLILVLFNVIKFKHFVADELLQIINLAERRNSLFYYYY